MKKQIQDISEATYPAPKTAASRPYRILVLDDEVAIAHLVKEIFEAEGMLVTACYEPVSALQITQEASFDVAIVDIMMPVMDGYEFYHRLQNIADIPVVFLSAKNEETDIVVGFALGADDYVVKPFKPRELVARVKARLRKRYERTCVPLEDQEEPGSPSRLLQSKGIVVDVKSHYAALHDIALSLTPKEFDILALLLMRVGEPVSSSELYEECWHEAANASSANTVMVHIRHLRRKLAEIDSSTEFIETAWGVGYRIAQEIEAH